jgi:hypothetical protein
MSDDWYWEQDADLRFTGVTAGDDSFFLQVGYEASELLRNAESVMRFAKTLGQSCYQFFSPAMNASAFRKLALESSLRKVIERDELALFYQPKGTLAAVCRAGTRPCCAGGIRTWGWWPRRTSYPWPRKPG